MPGPLELDHGCDQTPNTVEARDLTEQSGQLVHRREVTRDGPPRDGPHALDVGPGFGLLRAHFPTAFEAFDGAGFKIKQGDGCAFFDASVHDAPAGGCGGTTAPALSSKAT